jgi:hippurate hydrolase
MAGEDFSLYALEDPKPSISMFWLGAVDPQRLQDAREKGTRLPGPHASEFAPVPEPTIRTGVKAVSRVVLGLMKKMSAMKRARKVSSGQRELIVFGSEKRRAFAIA